MPDPKNRKTELPKKVDTRYADNLKMVLEKHERQNNQPVQEDSKITESRFTRFNIPEKVENPINMAKAMYEATSEANKEKIAQERYGEFGFDTLTYDQQQEVYEKYPKLLKSEKDKGSDFEGPLSMLKPTSPFSKSRCWKGYQPVPGKKAYSKGSCEKI